jgi:hypothetical protein
VYGYEALAMNIYHPDKLPPLLEAAVADLQEQVKQLQDTLALQKRSYEREIELEIAAERERCAKVCDDIGDEYQRREGMKFPELRTDAETGASKCAAAIRAGDTAP